MHPKKHLLFGALLSVLSFFSTASGNTLVKLLNAEIPVFQILFLQTMVGLISMPLFCLWQKKTLSYCRSKNYGLLLARILFSIGAFCFMYISIDHVPVTNATLLLNTAPLFIPLILFCGFGEKIDHRLWAGIIPGFIGIALILHPGTALFQPYALFSIISGVCMAALYIVMRDLHSRKEPMPRVFLYLYFGTAIFTLPIALYYWASPTFLQWIYLALISLCSFLGQSLLTLSLLYGTPKALAPLCYTSVVFTLIFDWLFWQHIPSWSAVLGIILVITGGIVALLLEVKLKEIDG